MIYAGGTFVGADSLLTAERLPDITSKQLHWRQQQVDDFVEAFDDHRAFTFQPLEIICVDESI
jgi:hypothetical protein